MTRYSQAEKKAIIRLVETSDLPVKQTLAELEEPRSTFYDWNRRYTERGYDGLAARQPQQQQFWNHIPDQVREQVVDVALEKTELSPRQLAWHLTDTQGYFISESSVYRILKGYDLVTSPVFQLMSAQDKFDHPTKRVNELWRTIAPSSRSSIGATTICVPCWTTTHAISCPGGWQPPLYCFLTSTGKNAVDIVPLEGIIVQPQRFCEVRGMLCRQWTQVGGIA
jgi:transposase-like protein